MRRAWSILAATVLMMSAGSAIAQSSCPPGVESGSILVSIAKLEKAGPQLIVTYVVENRFNIPMTIHPSQWGPHNRHLVRDSLGSEWPLQRRYGAARPNFRIEAGDRMRGTLSFLLQEGDTSASSFNIMLNFMTIPAGGGVKLGQSRMVKVNWRDVRAGCETRAG